MSGGFLFTIGAFTKKSDVLNLEINAKGTPHTDEELARVQEMLMKEGENI